MRFPPSKCPQPWPNETVVVVGGGVSLENCDLSITQGKRVIAVNNAFRVVPWAKYLFFADRRWWDWNGADAMGFKGQIITTTQATLKNAPVMRMRREYVTPGQYDNETPISLDPHFLTGNDGGHMAVNLAYHLGASRIILAGFDMGFTDGRAHHHADHPVASQEENYLKVFAPQYPNTVRFLKTRGIEVLRCTPSKLDFIPEAPLAEALLLPRLRRDDIHV